MCGKRADQNILTRITKKDVIFIFPTSYHYTWQFSFVLRTGVLQSTNTIGDQKKPSEIKKSLVWQKSWQLHLLNYDYWLQDAPEPERKKSGEFETLMERISRLETYYKTELKSESDEETKNKE